MTIDEIKQLIHVLIDTGVAELEVQRGEDRVWIRRAGPAGVNQEASATPMPVVYAAPNMAAATANAATAGGGVITSTAHVEPQPEAGLITVKSPIVGTYYESPSPGAPPFVKVGDAVQPGQVLCIIESMKLMNEIESEVAGVIVAKLVENGSPIEYGEALFTIRLL